MFNKKLLRNIFLFVLCFVFLFADSSVCIAESFFETQFDYETSDIAWLSDLNIKLNLDTVSGIIDSLTLTPVTDYPYSETAESFKTDVDNFANINLINEGAPRSAYIYFFQILSSSEGLIAGEMSDSDIQTFFKAQGIEYDVGNDSDSLMVARAVYTAIVTGVLTDYTDSSSLEDLAVDFLCNLSGMDKDTLNSWLPDSEDAGLDDYLLATSKSALWTAGYDVENDTDESTVYKLVACMVIEKNGITADASSDFNSLKLKFLSAMLSEKYDIASDWEAVGEAIENDSLPLYVLKTIGMRDGVSVGDKNFEDAFEFIAENTDEFDLENQFYADIYSYTAEIPSDTVKLWINATPVCSNGTVVIVANGTTLKNSYYTVVDLDAADTSPLITVSVTSVQGGATSNCSYQISFAKKTSEEETVNKNTEQISEAVDKIFLSSETLLSGILQSISYDTTSSFGKALEVFDSKTKSVMSVIAPTFEDTAESESNVSTEEECILFLDKIGGIIDSDISGIDGIYLLSEISSDITVSDLISFDY